MPGDWIRLHRKALDSRAFSSDWLWRLWCWCLMRANWKTRWKDGRELLPGQFTLGRLEAADQLRVSPSRLYRGLHTLQEWSQIRLEANSRFTVVTICNWRVYQCQEDDERTAGEQPVNNERTAGEQPVNTPSLLVEEGEEGKEGKKEARPPKRFTPPSLEEVAAYCRDRGNRVDPEVFLDHYQSNGWKVGGKAPMKDWKAAVRTWEKRESEFGGRNGRQSNLFFGIRDFINGGPPGEP